MPSLATVARSLGPRKLFASRTRSAIRFDLMRLRARIRGAFRSSRPTSDKLHLGCGGRRVAGWYNVDIRGSDFDVDLAAGYLPWPDQSFSVVLSQQVIEHLELQTELLPMLRELHRVCRDGAEIWLACPDLERVCAAYATDRGTWLIEDRKSRWPSFTMDGAPAQHIINVLFHQSGEHKNLYDLEIVRWAAESAGFKNVRRVDEKTLLSRFPEFPARNDDDHALYVVMDK